MNAITFLALLFTSGYAVIPVPEPLVPEPPMPELPVPDVMTVPPALEVRGSFNCTYNKDAVTTELRDSYSELFEVDNDNKVSSKNVSVGDSFLLSSWLPWFYYFDPYIVIRHRCNPSNKDTVVECRLGFSPPELLPHLFDLGVINLDNLESSRCLKVL
ncbi:hypothetical protein V3C99_018929 [Haemonchus contortus]